MAYHCNTEEDRREMLRLIGVRDIGELFADLPREVLFGDRLDLPPALSEIEASSLLQSIGSKNRLLASFIGAGAYNHYIPAAVDALASRPEFYTAYTPYQPEVSQGTLTAIFEFQTMMCRLTGMDISNASMYDGATALAESVLMALHAAGKSRVLVCDSLHPHYRQVLRTYCWANHIEMTEMPSAGGAIDGAQLEISLGVETGACVVQQPNFFGCIEDLAAIARAVHDKKAKLIAVVNEPLSLGLLRSPGSLGADIVCGEAQSFGNPAGFGGPALGFIAARTEFMRRLPGRLVGRSVDADGREAYVLTLQTREQHIRREKATSNICSNEGLCALRAAIHLSLLGNSIGPLAAQNHRLASYCRKRLVEMGFEPVFDRPYFNEFVVRKKNSREIIARLAGEGFAPGLAIEDYYKEYRDCVLICCTEMNAPQEIDRLAAALGKIR